MINKKTKKFGINLFLFAILIPVMGIAKGSLNKGDSHQDNSPQAESGKNDNDINAESTIVQFEKAKIKIKGIMVLVEVAKSTDQQKRGLMFRKSMPTSRGMIFVFPFEQVLSFWMKNTFIDLSIGFFNSKRELLNIHEMEASQSVMQQNPKLYPSNGPSLYALEMNKGWFTKHKIKVGDRFEWVKQ